MEDIFHLMNHNFYLERGEKLLVSLDVFLQPGVAVVNVDSVQVLIEPFGEHLPPC